MIDNNGMPDAWIYDGGRVHCAAHAEKRWGGALYREPRPCDGDGRAIKPAVMSGPDKCWECQQSKRGAGGDLAAAQALVRKVRS